IANQRDIAVAQAALNRLLGQPLSTELQPSDTLAIPPPLPELEPIVQRAMAARPELKSAESRIAGARAATTLAKESWLPDFKFGALRDNTQPQSPQYFFGISMPVPIFFWQHTSGDIAEASHRTQELVASSRDLRASVEQDVRATYALASTAFQQVSYLSTALL